MNFSATEIENIVRVVLQRLAAGRDLMAGVTEITAPPVPSTELSLGDRVITTRSLDGRLAGMRTLRVLRGAVVTPAVLDILRTEKIELRRDSVLAAAGGVSPATRTQSNLRPTGQSKGGPTGSSAGAASASEGIRISPPVLVCGSAIWFNSLTRHLCPQQAIVEPSDDPAALALAGRHLAASGQHVVWLSSTPFAAAALAQKGIDAVALLLPTLAELAAAREQAQPKVLIVDASRWTVAAIGNLVRALARSR